MFGIDTTVLAFVVLAGFSAGAVAYAFLFTRMSNEKKAGKRLETIKTAETDRSVVKASRDRVAEAAKRRKSVQDTLKELDEKQKTNERNVKKPPLKAQIRQAGMTGLDRALLHLLGRLRHRADGARLFRRRAAADPAGRAARRRARPAALVRLVSPRAGGSRRSSTNFPTPSTSSCAPSSPACRSTTPSA